METLIVARGGYDLSLDQSATRKQTELLTLGEGVLSVTNPDEQSTAVAAMTEIKGWLKKVEAARKTVKEPILEVGKRIDRIAADHCAPLEFEYQRLSKLVSFFQEDERKRAAEYERLRQEEIQKQLATGDEGAITDAMRIAPMEPARETGMVVKKVVKWEITDAAKLFAKFPHWFDLVPRKAVINASVTAESRVEGLKVWEETQTSVRS